MSLLNNRQGDFRDETEYEELVAETPLIDTIYEQTIKKQGNPKNIPPASKVR